MVSFLNDAASDMLAPILPLFLTAVLGAGPAAVGLIEGTAEAAASLLKLWSGRLADRGVSPKRLVVAGYGLSNLARPLMGLAFAWGWVLLLRFLDRVGKGLRTAPRDALISAAVDSALRGRAFGFHRAMDHGGAMLGPLIAFSLLQAGMEMRTLFLVSIVPGALLMLLLIRGVQDPPRPPRIETPPPLRWRALDRRLRLLVVATGVLAFAAVPDAFLVLWAHAQGLALVWVPLLWAVAHALRSAVTLLGGMLSDRCGRLAVLAVGWSLRVLMLILLALAENGPWVAWGLFLAYAAATAFTEGPERALVGDRAPPAQRATAFGLYHLVAGLLALPGALLFGALWQYVEMRAAFLTAAALTALAAAAVIREVRSGGAQASRA